MYASDFGWKPGYFPTVLEHGGVRFLQIRQFRDEDNEVTHVLYRGHDAQGNEIELEVYND